MDSTSFPQAGAEPGQGEESPAFGATVGVEAGLRVLAYVKAAGGVRAIVEHLGLPTASAHLAPARAPPQTAWC
jgi:hypothetical protein